MKTGQEVGTAKRVRKKNKVHAIGASRPITAYPLLGLVGKENNNCSGVPREHAFIPEALRVFYVYIGVIRAYLGLKNGWYNTENKVRQLDMYPLAVIDL